MANKKLSMEGGKNVRFFIVKAGLIQLNKFSWAQYQQTRSGMIRKCLFFQNAVPRGDCKEPNSDYVFSTRNVFEAVNMKVLQTYHLFSLLTDL